MDKLSATRKPLSLHPLKFQEAVTDILKVKPQPKTHKGKKTTKAKIGASESGSK